QEVFTQTAAAKSAPLYSAWDGFGSIASAAATGGSDRRKLIFQPAGDAERLALDTDLSGSFQLDNIRTVLAAVRILADRGWNVSFDVAAQALRHGKERTGLRGRWDILREGPLVVADVAHNPDGIAAGMAEWAQVVAAR